MLNNIIVWSRTGKEGNQHAYFPQRGVHTAWRSLLTKLDSPDIMEYDLRGFFDMVDHSILRWHLVIKKQLPPHATLG